MSNTDIQKPADGASIIDWIKWYFQSSNRNLERNLDSGLAAQLSDEAMLRMARRESVPQGFGDVDDPAIKAMFKEAPLTGSLAYVLGFGTWASRLIDIWLRPILFRLESTYQNQIPSLADFLNFRTQNISVLDVESKSFDQYAAMFGLKREWWAKLVEANGTIPSPGQLLELLNRQDGKAIRGTKQYTEKYIRDALLKSTLKDEFIDDILELRYNLLGASDYIRFAVRDAYTKDPTLADTLIEGFPDILRDKLKALGYNPEDADAAWRAHWDLPSPGQVFEMLHRNVLPPGDPDTVVSNYLAQADYDPRWREPLKAISYDPITRTDAKRAFKLKVQGFDEARLKQAYKDLGYADSDADLLVTFTKQDVGEEARQERELLTGPIRTQALNLYRARRITETELRKTLADLGYTQSVVDRYVTEIEFARVVDHREEVASALKAAYVKGLRSEDDTRTLLVQGGWPEDAVEQVLEPWRLLRQATELQPHQTAQRDLTQAQLVTAYADHLLDRTEAFNRLKALGYDDGEAETILALQDYKTTQDDLKLRVDNVHFNFLRFAYDEAGASTELSKIGLPVLRIRNLVMQWAREREKQTPDFALSALESMVKQGVMAEDVAARYLEAQGWLPEQRTYLLSWWLGRRQPPTA